MSNASFTSRPLGTAMVGGALAMALLDLLVRKNLLTVDEAQGVLSHALPLLSAAVSFLLMLGLPRATWERLIVWMAVGVVLYFAYGRRHSRLRTAD